MKEIQVITGVLFLNIKRGDQIDENVICNANSRGVLSVLFFVFITATGTFLTLNLCDCLQQLLGFLGDIKSGEKNFWG